MSQTEVTQMAVLVRSQAATLVDDLPVELRGVDPMTTGQAAQALGVSSVNTIKNWIRAGYIKERITTPGGQTRIPRREILRVRALERGLQEMPVVDELTSDELDDLSH